MAADGIALDAEIDLDGLKKQLAAMKKIVAKSAEAINKAWDPASKTFTGLTESFSAISGALSNSFAPLLGFVGNLAKMGAASKQFMRYFLRRSAFFSLMFLLSSVVSKSGK